MGRTGCCLVPSRSVRSVVSVALLCVSFHFNVGFAFLWHVFAMFFEILLRCAPEEPLLATRPKCAGFVAGVVIGVFFEDTVWFARNVAMIASVIVAAPVAEVLGAFDG